MLNVRSVCASVQTKLSETRGLSQVIYVALGGTGLYWDMVSLPTCCWMVSATTAWQRSSLAYYSTTTNGFESCNLGRTFHQFRHIKEEL